MSLRIFIFTELIPWPASAQELNPATIFQPYIDEINTIEQSRASEDDPKLLDLSLTLFDNDASRRTSIDSRAGWMMSAITLAATLVTGVGFTTLKDSNGLSGATIWAMFLTFVFALLYLTATIVLLFQIHGALIRSTPDPTDLRQPAAPPANPSRYPRDVSVRLLRYTIANYRVNNEAMNRLEIAQKCFRNALLVLAVGGIATSVLIIRAPIPGSAATDRAIKAASQADAAAVRAENAPNSAEWSATSAQASTSKSEQATTDITIERTQQDEQEQLRMSFFGELQKARDSESRHHYCALQRSLRGLGFDPGPLDGFLGPNTRTAVAAYARAHQLPSDISPDDDRLLVSISTQKAKSISPLARF